MNTPAALIETLSKTYPTAGKPAVDAVSFDVQPGEIHALVGESGSGKSTILRLIAGFESADSGRVTVGNRLVLDCARRISLEPERRRVGMIFQETALFHHLTVRRNIGFGVPRHLRRDRVDELTAALGIDDLGERYPHEISGGQAQRVALARALAPGPELLLMDEIFNNLDQRLKTELMPEVRDILRHTHTSVIFVSHDRSEIFDFADRISVLRAGRIMQSGRPQDLYEHPVSAYVGELFGEAVFLHEGNARFLLRPESVLPGCADDTQTLPVLIEHAFFSGESIRYMGRFAHDSPRFVNQQLIIRTLPTPKPHAPGSRIHVRIPDDSFTPMDAEPAGQTVDDITLDIDGGISRYAVD